ncbi:hypothetical protein BCR34DRAFT_600507 [Clohesyomyces aquaticus]|uniref:Uncharacterized protein n=1 Tax=Clohesyomyces aquaticus TaxID=1231657 RepID=A0A1Y1ZS22_9PLEO|nr:hypothetical protein BCR34DRAFT_600507 [Clohesyomyces aquaticus]
MPHSSIIDVHYDFEEKELMLRFDTKEHALAYQANEARILRNKPPNAVWLPVKTSMRYVRSSTVGLLINLETPLESVLGVGKIRPNDKEDVYIKPVWENGELEKILGIKESALLKRGAGSTPASLSPSKRPEPFDF